MIPKGAFSVGFDPSSFRKAAGSVKFSIFVLGVPWVMELVQNVQRRTFYKERGSPK
jgi:hypothetical protein